MCRYNKTHNYLISTVHIPNLLLHYITLHYIRNILSALN